ncbi:MAG: hypothetical protein H0U57_10195 [Tatlockia sp.]|nr:hypothetical protein [Tatlockia sp.]
MQSKLDDSKLKIKSLKQELKEASLQSEQHLIGVKYNFLKAIINPTPETQSGALESFNKYKDLYQETNSQNLLKFFIENQIFLYFKESSLPFNTGNKSVGDYILHTMGCYTKKTIDSGAFALLLGLAASPLLAAAAIISGISDSETRKQLDSTQLIKLFNNLGQVTGQQEKEKLIEIVFNKYNERGWSLASEDSQQLLKFLSPESSLSIDEKWDNLLYYITNTERNNGKALFTIIDETARNQFLDTKMGFKQMHSFQNNEQLPSDVTNLIKEKFLQIKQNEQDNDIQPSAGLKK